MRELLPPAQLQGSSDGIKVDVKKTPDLGAANAWQLHICHMCTCVVISLTPVFYQHTVAPAGRGHFCPALPSPGPPGLWTMSDRAGATRQQQNTWDMIVRAIRAAICCPCSKHFTHIPLFVLYHKPLREVLLLFPSMDERTER